jgi:predicted small lipoprotein YifL
MSRVLRVLLVLAAAASAACGQRLPTEPPAEAAEPADAETGADPSTPTGTPLPVPDPTLPPEAPDGSVARARPYRGLGAWIDVFDGRLWRDPEGVVARLDGRGVRTLFLQTTTYRLRGPLRFPRAAGRFLDAAHARGMAVVGWYVPSFAKPRRDLAMLLGAVAFRSPGGGSFDSVAVDIEVTKVADPVERARRAVALSRKLRDAVGPDYRLGGIIPSPLRGPEYWPILPTAQLARVYDVLLPMAYWSHSRSGAAGARGYISRSLQIVRSEAGPNARIHMIGGVADGTTPAEIRAFARASRGTIGLSVYDVATMNDAEWAALAG